MKHLGIVTLCLLCGCTAPLKLPVAVSCVPDALPARPRYPDSNDALLAADGMDERYRLMIAGRELRIMRLQQLETVVQGCRR